MESAVEQFVTDLNETWRQSRFDALYDFFHPSAGMLPPGSETPIFGADVMVESYREFMTLATVQAFEIRSCLVRVYGAVAICLIQFEIDYRIDSLVYRERGWEHYTIDIGGAALKVLWRAQFPLVSGER